MDKYILSWKKFNLYQNFQNYIYYPKRDTCACQSILLGMFCCGLSSWKTTISSDNYILKIDKAVICSLKTSKMGLMTSFNFIFQTFNSEK